MSLRACDGAWRVCESAAEESAAEGLVIAAARARVAAERKVRKPTVSAQKLGQLQPFIAVFAQECMGQLASFGPALTPFSLKEQQREELERKARQRAKREEASLGLGRIVALC